VAAALARAEEKAAVTRYVRFRHGPVTAYGILEGDAVKELRGGLFANPQPTGKTYPLSGVKLLYPCQPPKVLAVGANYKSHIGSSATPANPEIFYKPISALQNPGDPIVLPKDSTVVHYEGELVLVIGKRVRHASAEEAREGHLRRNLRQRRERTPLAKRPAQGHAVVACQGSNTFAPLGPVIAKGLDYSKLLLRAAQRQGGPEAVDVGPAVRRAPIDSSFISRYVELAPGDVIYTGTPGKTDKIAPGDVVEWISRVSACCATPSRPNRNKSGALFVSFYDGWMERSEGLFVQTAVNVWRNKLRSFLTMFGIAWGIVSLVLMSLVRRLPAGSAQEHGPDRRQHSFPVRRADADARRRPEGGPPHLPERARRTGAARAVPAARNRFRRVAIRSGSRGSAFNSGDSPSLV
jgi:2-keto-4-pentenoate hydratase/2-oxohepta-3-ene-1,7-dioic acid hydratase in catechol pathway